jgi:hypothetical protein
METFSRAARWRSKEWSSSGRSMVVRTLMP